MPDLASGQILELGCELFGGVQVLSTLSFLLSRFTERYSWHFPSITKPYYCLQSLTVSYLQAQSSLH